MSEEQAAQFEEASNLWFKEIREEREKNARLTDQLAAIDRTLLSCEYERNKYASEVMELEKRNAELVEVLKLSNHREHDWDDHGKCLCCQCEFVRGRDKALKVQP
jgi:hypothetical protein